MNSQIISGINILLFSLLLSCNNANPTTSICEIIIANPIKDNYSYSDDAQIDINHQKYLLRYKAKYINGEIISFVKYTSEGVVNYTIEELKNDTSVYSSLEIPLQQKWEMTSGLKLNAGDKRVNLIKLDNCYYRESNGRRIFVPCVLK